MVNYDNIPEELRKLTRWVSASEGNKCPMKSWENEGASSTDPNTWSTFEIAKESYDLGLYDYCGFVFAEDGYVGIDIDDGRDADGFLSPLASEIIGTCQSYTEKSRSGRGFHIIVKGDLPFKGKNNLNGVEIYKASRYFIMTGNVLIYKDIKFNQGAIDYVVEKYFSDTREATENEPDEFYRIYTPKWENVVFNGKIKLHPSYPPIPSGGRNLSLTSLAGQMHTIGYTPQAILNELVRANAEACIPPLEGRELKQIVNSVTRYRR